MCADGREGCAVDACQRILGVAVTLVFGLERERVHGAGGGSLCG